MVVWKPPALLIIGGTFAVLFLGLGALLVNVLGILSPGELAGAVATVAWGVGIVVADVGYRRKNDLAMSDQSRSTVFFVVPTWLVGIAVIVVGMLRYGS